MGNTTVRGTWDRGAADDLWRHTLAQIQSVFGRIAYLASLRNQATGRYEHHGLAVAFGTGEAEETLRQSHEAVFFEWLAKPLAEQKADVQKHLSQSEEDSRRVVQNWIRLRPYEGWVPATSRTRDRQLFVSDMETLLEAIRVELGVAANDPDA